MMQETDGERIQVLSAWSHGSDRPHHTRGKEAHNAALEVASSNINAALEFKLASSNIMLPEHASPIAPMTPKSKVSE